MLKFFRRTAHVVSILILLFVVGCASSSPGEQQGKKTNGQPDSSQTLVDETGAQIAASPPPQSRDPKWESNEWGKWTYDALRPSVLVNLALVACAIWAGCIALGTLNAIRAEVGETKKAADAASRSADAAWMAGRAYVAMTDHEQKTTISKAKPDGSRTAHLKRWAENFGNTPANTDGAFLCLHIGTRPLPDDVESLYVGDTIKSCHFFLITRGGEFVEKNVPISQADWKRIEDGARVWVLGYVDYTDQLDEMRRARYAREFAIPTSSDGSGNVTEFTFEKHIGYNYERPLTPKEREEYAKG